MIYSHSRTNTFKLCPKQFEYRYIRNLYPLSSSKGLALGKLLHKGIELKSSNNLNEYVDDIDASYNEETENIISLAMAMTDAYFDKFGINEKIKNELHFLLNLDGYNFQGYIDGIIEEEHGYWLLEIKTASRVDKEYIDKLKYNDQVSRYYYAIEQDMVDDFKLDKPLLGIKYRIIKKPLIRQKASESIVEFRNRLREKLNEDGYIEELILTRNRDEIEDCILDTIEDIKAIEHATRYTKTLSACTTYGRCPYMELCSNEENAELLYIERPMEEEGGEEDGR